MGGAMDGATDETAGGTVDRAVSGAADRAADRAACGPAERFIDAAVGLLERVREEETGSISAAGTLIADAFTGGGRIFAFGAGHSSLPAQDVVYRAGGLAVLNLLPVPGAVGVDVMPATLGSALERVEGLASAVLETSPARAGDVLVVISLSGRNALPVEMASRARELGLKVIGVTSVAYASATSPRNPSGTFLKDHCDIVVDSKIAVGDAELTMEGAGAPFAPASTVVTGAIMQAVVASAVGTLAARGVTPPLLRSGNVDGGHEWNARVMAEHADRIFHLR